MAAITAPPPFRLFGEYSRASPAPDVCGPDLAGQEKIRDTDRNDKGTQCVGHAARHGEILVPRQQDDRDGNHRTSFHQHADGNHGVHQRRRGWQLFRPRIVQKGQPCPEILPHGGGGDVGVNDAYDREVPLLGQYADGKGQHPQRRRPTAAARDRFRIT